MKDRLGSFEAYLQNTNLQKGDYFIQNPCLGLKVRSALVQGV